ncbi:MAG: T9SS type A sorting domain-containing protein [Ignavibacteriaceae bacterium]
MNSKLFIVLKCTFIIFTICINGLNAQWIKCADVNGFDTRAFLTNDTILYAGFEGKGVYITTNGGNNWVSANTGLNNPTFVCTFVNIGKTIFVGTEEGAYLSTNIDSGWVAVDSSLTNEGILSFSINNQGDIFAGTVRGLFYSIDTGKTWITLDSEFVSINTFAIITNSLLEENIFAGTDGDVFLSSDNGSTWEIINNTWRGVVCAFAVKDNNLFVGTDGYGIFLTTNRGINWTSMNSGLSSNSVLSLALCDTVLFAGTTDGVFISSNNGITWSSVNSGLVNNVISALTVYDSKLFAGTHGGIWYRPLSELITSIEKPSFELSKFYLYQNYPNPFNPITTITYSLPKNSFVTLKIYDLLGREVVTLVNEEKHSGTYKVIWNAQNKPSGIYFYKITAGGYSKAHKMILMK